ncbi:MAG: cation:proton antiporter [Aquificaceae bacterium]
MVLEVLSIIFMFVGAFFLLAGSIGLIRLKDAYSRLHALTKADVLGFGFITLSCILSTDLPSHWIKLFLVWLLVISYSSLVGYALANRKRNA